MFDDLKGIKEREIKRRERTALDDLLELNDKIVIGEIKINLDKYEHKDIKREREKLREIVSKIEYNEDDLVGFVLSQCNKDYDEEIWRRVGFLSGVLLSYLTDKKRFRKRTIIEIDFGWNEFNYLFYYTKYADVVIVKNLVGDHALEEVASKGGWANQVVGVGIKGNWALSGIASEDGRVNQVIGVNIEGDRALWGVASYNNGMVNQVIGVGIKGNLTLHSVASNNGKVNQVIGVGIKEGNALGSVASYGGWVSQVIGAGIEGYWALNEVVSYGGKANQVVGVDIKGDFALSLVALSHGLVDQVILYNIVGEGILNGHGYIKELIKGEKAKRLLKQYGINDIIAIAESMKEDRDWRVIADKANRIYSIYEKIAKERGWRILIL